MIYCERECVLYRELEGVNIALDKVEYIEDTVYEVMEEYPSGEIEDTCFKVEKRGHDVAFQEALNYFNDLIQKRGK